MESKETVQISATIDRNIHQSVKEEAVKDNRSFSEMVGMLLSQAIKEKERLRNKNKKTKQE